MKLKYKDQEAEVLLKTSWVGYNCSVKMVGRLVPEVNGKVPSNWTYDKELLGAMTNNKKELIKEWVASLDNVNTFPQLNAGGNPIFPNDGGKYLPSVILFADAMNGYANENWSMLTMVREFQRDPDYGMTVILLPAYHNRTYGTYGAPRFSRVFALYPPSMKSMVFIPKNKDLKKEFRNKEYVESVSQDTLDQEEFLAALP